MKKSKLIGSITKYIPTKNYYFKFHGNNALNRNVISKGSSHIEIEKRLNMEADKSSHDFFNPNLISESEISKKFINEVIACCLNPNIINSPRKDFMEESKRKAETYIKTVKVGAYSCSKGLEPVRKNILEKLRKRDNVELDESDIYLVAGGMDAYHHIISLFPKGTKMLVPSPCYPLYLSMNKSLDIASFPYKLNNEIEITNNLNAKVMLVINPQNPTGKLLDRREMEKIVKFCVDNKMILIASEVLQDLIHDEDKKFLSFRSVINSLPDPYNKLELFSFYSASKNSLFQSSIRSGFLDVMNLDADVKKELYKHICMDICTNVCGQIMLDLLISPSFEKSNFFSKEFTKNYYDSLHNSKKNLSENFYLKFKQLSSNEFFKINKPVAGFTYFIELILPNPQENFGEIYSRALYEETGIVSTPGNEYGDFPNHIAIHASNDNLNFSKISAIKNFNYFFLKLPNGKGRVYA